MRSREGDERLSEGNPGDSRDTAGNREKADAKRAPKSGGKKNEGGGKGGGKGGANDVGRVLRSVYDRALREEVPSDFLDLLGKLG